MQTIGKIHDSSIYLHVPFCQTKCPYCHFYVIPYEKEREELYVQAIEKEWELYRSSFESNKIVSFYLGGGTPSLLSPSSINYLLDLLLPTSLRHACEITIEANPESITLEKMRAFRSLGINRLSIGVQSLDDHQLILLDRRHRATRAIEAIETSCEAGFDNISIDLMYDIPGQSLQSWQRTVDRAMKLPITHLSLYNLTFEPQTLFFKKQRALKPLLPSQEESLKMLEYAISTCESAGLLRYEISAFARDNKVSVHNTGYWQGRPFIGLGPSAFSYYEGKRFKNASSFTKWMTALEEKKSPVDFEEQLPQEAAFRELLAIQLRLVEGVDFSLFTTQRGPCPADLFPILTQLINAGFLGELGNHLFLTEQGRLFYDTVAEEII